jgi:hypothetical protein
MRFERLRHLSIRCTILYMWEFKMLLTLWYVLLFLKIWCSQMYIIMSSFGGMGGLYFIISFTSNIVVLFLVRIGAVLLLRKHFVSHACTLCFRRTLYCFYGMIISVVGCRQSSCSYNVDSSSAEYRRTCTSVCKHVSFACLFVPKKLNYLRLKKRA